ncbi:methyltransferase domain-containing protein [Patescibacteria group bacterium]|nr:methyltransferase domain-containing protein [Patescibacteria group bacterium]
MSAGTDLLNIGKILEDVDVWPGMHVADFGVGRTGAVTISAARIVGEEGEVYAVDIMPDVLKSVCNQCAFQGLTNVHPVWGDFERPGGVRLPAESLHFVFCVNNFWCMGHPEAMVKEARRLLSDEGKLLVIDWKKDIVHPIAPPTDRLMNLREAKRFLKDVGATSLEEVPVNDTHWGLLASFA